jgi:hypothetical protein
MAGKLEKVSYAELWALRNKSPEEYQVEIDKQIGYYIHPKTEKVTITPKFHNDTIHASITELTAFLSGAPIPILQLYLHLLPLKHVKKVALCYPMSQMKQVENAYYKPTMITDKDNLLEGM